MSQPLVSVWCSAYNHEKYIAQAIEGFVMQKTDFEIEIFLHDDASTDETANIIRAYAARHPQIKPILLTENKFSVDKSYLNRIMFEKTRGKYIAMCEGDDYWIDPLKLQKQIDFLEASPEFAICFHAVKVVHENGETKPHSSNLIQKEITTFEDLADANYIHTPSCVFRNHLFGELPSWFGEMPAGDYVLHLLNAQHGKIKFLSDEMAVYRVHDGGIWSSNSAVDLHSKWVKVAKMCKKYFAPRGDDGFSKQLAASYKEICFANFNAGAYAEFRTHYVKLLKFFKYLQHQTKIALTVRYALSFSPQIAERYKTARSISSL